MSHQSRRQFLGTSVALAGAATLPFASSRASAASKAANERLRVAIHGMHSRGKEHLSCWSNREDVEVAAIVDPDEEVGQKACEEIQKKTGKRPTYYSDPRKANDDASLDIMSLATPNHWHALETIWAIQAGKDVYVEKPVSHNVVEGRRMTEAARKYNKICQYGAQCRTMKGSRDMALWVRDGGIGEVSLARGLCYKRRKEIGPEGKYDVPENVDYSVWLGPASLLDYVPRKQFHYDWHWQWPYGNGDLGNQGIHQMDVARWGLGADGLGDGVVAYGGRLGYSDAGTTPNTEVCIHTFGDKTLIFETRGLETEGYSPMPGKIPGTSIGVVFTGKDGYAIQYSYNSSAAYDLKGNKIKEFKGGGTRDHFDNFLQAVRSRDASQLNADIEDGHLSSALCHLGNISYQLGNSTNVSEIAGSIRNDAADETLERTLEHLKKNGVDVAKSEMKLGPHLKLSGERFTGSNAEQANNMLSREYRKPFAIPETSEL